LPISLIARTSSGLSTLTGRKSVFDISAFFCFGCSGVPAQADRLKALSCQPERLPREKAQTGKEAATCCCNAGT